MKVLNSGSADIKLISQGVLTILKPSEETEMSESSFVALHKIFPALIAAVEPKEVVLESKPQPIETKPKAKKNGTRKKSK